MIECPLCMIDSRNHSLKFLGEKNNTHYYYCCPAEARMYFDTDGILYHYNLVFSRIPRDKNWIWIFDASGFGLKHVLNPQVGIKLAQLISEKYSDNLNKIIVYGFSSYVSTIYNIIKPFLSSKIKDIIEFKNESFEII